MAIRAMNWDEYLGSKVRIYRNLNNGTMSIQIKDGKAWKVVGHVRDCVVSNVTFKVQEGGKNRVRTEKRKNVHAWGEGTLVAQFDERINAPIDLGYDPYTNDTFVQRHTSNVIVSCQYLVVRNNLVYVSQDAIASDQDDSFSDTAINNLIHLFGGNRMAFAIAAA